MDLDGFLKRINKSQKALAEEIGTTPSNYIVLHKSFLNRDFKKKKNQKEK